MSDFWSDPFIYFHIPCVRTGKALARLRECAGAPEPSLVVYVICTIISLAGSIHDTLTLHSIGHGTEWKTDGDSLMLFLLCWCFTALRYFSGHFGRGQSAYPHRSWAGLLGTLPVISTHSSISSWHSENELPFLKASYVYDLFLGSYNWATARQNQQNELWYSLRCALNGVLPADSEDSDQTGRMPRLIWVFAGRTVILLVLSCCGS